MSRDYDPCQSIPEGCENCKLQDTYTDCDNDDKAIFCEGCGEVMLPIPFGMTGSFLPCECELLILEGGN